jgi:hypothetical protein
VAFLEKGKAKPFLPFVTPCKRRFAMGNLKPIVTVMSDKQTAPLQLRELLLAGITAARFRSVPFEFSFALALG